MVTAERKLVSEEEFLRLPESTEKVELIDGEVFMAPAPTSRHHFLQEELHFALKSWQRSQEAGRYWVGQCPLDFRFRRGRILQPDIFVFEGELPQTHPGPLDIVPLLCVEVLSRDRDYDRITKRFVYADAG